MNLLTVIALLILPLSSTTHAESDRVDYAFFSSSSSTLEEHAASGHGHAVLIYYLASRGVEQPSLLVEFLPRAEGADAVARVFQAPADSNFVPYRRSIDGSIQIGSQPSLEITALGGWWRRQGITNYNLEVRVFGGVPSTWGPDSWTRRVAFDELTILISVRDEEGNGVPSWDLRRQVPFPRDGYYHVNYAHRTCDSAHKTDLGVTPAWPFIAAPAVVDNELRPAGGHEQAYASQRPPIVVSWDSGRILRFSEIVSLRRQSCSYGIYSLRQIEPGMTNDLDFETPFAFYDLREARDGFPDLIVRTYYVPPGVASGPEGFIRNLRYSWRVDPRSDWDLHFDYKIDVAGPATYASSTPIAGGFAAITAPSYDELPGWVMDREWPAVTFVDTEATQYRSSEGIYDWSTNVQELTGYLSGTEDLQVRYRDAVESWHQGMPEFRRETRVGTRGEYRVGEAREVQLYLSPLTSRPHLLHADGGLYMPTADTAIVARNVVPNGFLDLWRQLEDGSEAVLFHGLNHVVLIDQEGIWIRSASIPFSTSSHSPPTSPATLASFREEIEQARQQGPESLDVRKWFADVVGPSNHIPIPGLRYLDAWVSEGETRILTTAPSTRSDGNSPVAETSDAPHTQSLYLLSLATEGTGEFSLSRVDRAPIEAVIGARATSEFVPTEVVLRATNPGTVDARGPLGVFFGEELVYASTHVSIPAGGSVVLPIPWTPISEAPISVHLEVGGTRIALGALSIQQDSRDEHVDTSWLPFAPNAVVPILVFVAALITAIGAGVSIRLVQGHVEE